MHANKEYHACTYLLSALAPTSRHVHSAPHCVGWLLSLGQIRVSDFVHIRRRSVFVVIWETADLGPTEHAVGCWGCTMWHPFPQHRGQGVGRRGWCCITWRKPGRGRRIQLMDRLHGWDSAWDCTTMCTYNTSKQCTLLIGDWHWNFGKLCTVDADYYSSLLAFPPHCQMIGRDMSHVHAVHTTASLIMYVA